MIEVLLLDRENEHKSQSMISSRFQKNGRKKNQYVLAEDRYSIA